MNGNIFSVGLAFGIGLIAPPLLLAEGDENGIAHRVAALELQMTTLMAELERVSPDADLTGKTYCIFGQGTWLVAGNGGAAVVANPFSHRVDFISATEFAIEPIYDPYSWIVMPNYIMGDAVDSLDPEMGTYTIVGNRLTATVDGEDATFYMTPDAQVIVSGTFERSNNAGVDWWETAMIIGIQAASCD